MSVARRVFVLILAGLVGTGCGTLEVVPLTRACDLPPGQFVRGYVTSSGVEHVEDGYLSRDESGNMHFTPVDSPAVHVLPAGEVTGGLVRGPDRVGPAVVSVLEVVGVTVLYAGLLFLDAWLDHEFRSCRHR